MRRAILSMALLLLSLPAMAASERSQSDSWAPDAPSLPTERDKAFKRVRHDCRGELGLFCNGINKKNDEAAAECLAKHRYDLTKECRLALAAAKPYLESKPELRPKKAESAGEMP